MEGMYNKSSVAKGRQQSFHRQSPVSPRGAVTTLTIESSGSHTASVFEPDP